MNIKSLKLLIATLTVSAFALGTTPVAMADGWNHGGNSNNGYSHEGYSNNGYHGGYYQPSYHHDYYWHHHHVVFFNGQYGFWSNGIFFNVQF